MSNFLRQNKTKRTIFSPKFLVALFLLIIVATLYVLFPSIFSGTLHFVGEPIWKTQNAAVAKIISSSKLFQSKKALIEENIRLATYIEEMNTLILEKELLREENETLKEKFGRDINKNFLLAAVLARPNVSLYDTFVIDAGKKEGVKTGEKVLVSGNIVIGTISKVYKSTSIVTLFSAPGEKTEIMIGPEKILTTALGRGSGNFSTQLPRATDVVEGDIVIMPGINPKVFGVVESIIADSADPFRIILFKNPINLNEIRWVEIVIEDAKD